MLRTLITPGALGEIVARLRAVRPDDARRWGRMSAPQMICHVADTYRLFLDDRPLTLWAGPVRRAVVRILGLHLPLHWPHGVPTRADIDPLRAGTRPGDFAADVESAVHLAERFATSRPRALGRAHPIFGALTDREWQRWGYLHPDHHLRQFGR